MKWKLAALAPLLFVATEAAGAPRASDLLDGFDHPDAWRVVTSNQVSGSLRTVAGQDGPALCLDYDFNGVSGYVGLQRELPLDYPQDYQFSFLMRGASPANDLQFKLVDDSGDNVWWVNRPRYAFPAQWTPVTYRKRHISRAWGPAPDPTLRHSRLIEFTIYNSAGGKGEVCFDSLRFQPRAVPASPDPAPVARAKTHIGRDIAAKAVDGDAATAWRSAASGAELTVDLGRQREFGGVKLQWLDGEAATRYRIALSDDGRRWRDVREVAAGNGGVDPIALPESDARYLRLQLEQGQGGQYGLAEIAIEPLAFAATPNDFIREVAKAAPRGRYPRGFSEQPYWTIVGIDGGTEQGLIGEDGAIELAKGAFSIEPFVLSEGKLVGWADVASKQSLQDGYLPIPSVDWTHQDLALKVTAFAHGTPDRSGLVARYRLTNTTDRARDYSFVLAARPFQVNPPSQFLNTTGGVSLIQRVSANTSRIEVQGRPVVTMDQPATGALASGFDAGDVVERLARGERPGDAGNTMVQVDDATGLASAALVYAVRLGPGESREFAWRAPLSGDPPVQESASAAQLQAEVAAQWHDKLDRVRMHVPGQGQHVVDTLRTALAHMLISRTGPRLQPGTRSYARAWIRDGAMISEGLLRMGREDVAEEFLRWYAPYQFENGKVPCCVDDRGSDPVPENDSHGELIYTIAELYRYTHDRALLQAMWPHVDGAYRYMEELRRSERTDANRAVNAAFYGMMPASISHEGYSAKPMHSYWDNFWALRGYKDAVDVARWLGRDGDVARMAASRDQFREDLQASLDAATKAHAIDYMPGAAELGDFDATSSTIALSPGGEQGHLPARLLDNTFERYWREFVQRRDGQREWKDYTPYELRTIGSFVRLGWRERAHEALDFFFHDQQPRGWNQWAEVVSRTPRKPFFVGDLPHAWVESDYVRSVLDMFAYTREHDDALVIAAGIPADWLAGEGVEIAGLRSPYGAVAYSLRASGNELRLDVPAGIKVPAGGVVVALPPAWREGRTRVNGREVPVRDGELRVERLPASIRVDKTALRAH